MLDVPADRFGQGDIDGQVGFATLVTAALCIELVNACVAGTVRSRRGLFWVTAFSKSTLVAAITRMSTGRG